MLAIADVSFLFVATGVAKNEQSFFRQEWAFLFINIAQCSGRTCSPETPISPPRWRQRPSARSAALWPHIPSGGGRNEKGQRHEFLRSMGVKFVPSLMEMDPISIRHLVPVRRPLSLSPRRLNHAPLCTARHALNQLAFPCVRSGWSLLPRCNFTSVAIGNDRSASKPMAD